MQVQRIDCTNGINNRRNYQNQQNFKGTVGPLYSVTMRPGKVSTYFREFGHIDITKYGKLFFNALKAVGDREGFLVNFQKLDGHLSTNAEEIKPGNIDKEPSCWAQDNAIVICDRNGNPIILENGLVRETEENFAKTYAEDSGMRFKKMYSRADGGNTYFGVTADGERYILIGRNAIDDTALKIVLDQQGIKLESLLEASNGTVGVDFQGEKYYTSIDDIENGKISEDLPDALKQNAAIAMENLRKNPEKLHAEALNKLAEDFEMDTDQIRVVSSPEFHIDMFMRPIDDKTILVNDPELTKKELNAQLENSILQERNNEIRKLIARVDEFENQRVNKKGFASMEKIIEELKGLGYENIIRVPGVFDNGSTNYLNAFVHKKENGEYVYITNAGIGSNNGLDLNGIFRDVLKSSPLKIQTCYCLGGGDESHMISEIIGEDKVDRDFIVHNINLLLLLENGGFHCSGLDRSVYPKVVR